MGPATPAVVAGLCLLSVLPILFVLGVGQSLRVLLVVAAVACIVACEGSSATAAGSSGSEAPWLVLFLDPSLLALPKAPYCAALRRGAVSALFNAHLFYQNLWFSKKYRRSRRKVKHFFESPLKVRRY